ncbi:hypothetical protein JOM56_014325 [Amanita muscaria]
MEHGNFSAAAGFGFDPEDFGIFSTFSRWSFRCKGYSSHSNTLSYLPRLIDAHLRSIQVCYTPDSDAATNQKWNNRRGIDCTIESNEHASECNFNTGSELESVYSSMFCFSMLPMLYNMLLVAK